MRSSLRFVLAGTALLAALFALSTTVLSQAPARPAGLSALEYSRVTYSGVGTTEAGRTYYVAVICFAESSGCRNESVRAEGQDNAFMKAVAQLGEQGWDLVGVTSDSLLFRRPKY